MDDPQAITAVAWRQIAELGVGGLSLRAIARELGITAPAIYNYYARREDLVTALLLEAYTSFGDAQVAAYDAAADADPVARLTALGVAYRAWALANPERYQLLFGAPIPNYDCNDQRLESAAHRSIVPLIRSVGDLHRAGLLRTDDVPVPGLDQAAALAEWSAAAGSVHPAVLTAAMGVWCRVHGLVSLEIAGHLPPFGPDADSFYRYELHLINQRFQPGQSTRE